MNGPEGLNYDGVEVVERRLGFRRRGQHQRFIELQAMERATLKAWSEKKAETS